MNSDKPKPGSDEELQTWGVEQMPERIQHGDPRALIGNTTSHKHVWEARGDFLHCTNGNHGIPYDHINKVYTGKTDANNLPLLETRKIQKHTKRNGKVKISYHEVDS